MWVKGDMLGALAINAFTIKEALNWQLKDYF